MTQAEGTVQEAGTIDREVSADRTANYLKTFGKGISLLLRDTESGDEGAFSIQNAYEFPREQDTAFTVGQDAWLDTSATPEGGAATGAAVDNDGGGHFPYLGRVIEAAADDAATTTVKIKIEKPAEQSKAVLGGAGNLLVIQQDFTDADGDVSVFGTSGAPRALRVIDFICENQAANGANANTVQLCAAAAGASAISDALALNGKVDTDIVRAANIDDANASVAAGGALYIDVTKVGGTMGGRCTIYAVPA